MWECVTVLEKEGCLCKISFPMYTGRQYTTFQIIFGYFSTHFHCEYIPIYLVIYLSIYLPLCTHARTQSDTYVCVHIYIYTYILIRTHCTWVLTTQIIWNADNYEMFNNTCGYMNYTLTIQVLIIAAEQWWAGVSGTMCNIISFICVK